MTNTSFYIGTIHPTSVLRWIHMIFFMWVLTNWQFVKFCCRWQFNFCFRWWWCWSSEGYVFVGQQTSWQTHLLLKSSNRLSTHIVSFLFSLQSSELHFKVDTFEERIQRDNNDDFRTKSRTKKIIQLINPTRATINLHAQLI